MTQSQLADRVGIKFQQIQKYETGANRISASRMWEVANVLDVPIAFFFEGTDGQTAYTGETHGDILTDKEVGDLVRIYYSIPENQRRRGREAVVRCIREMSCMRPASPTLIEICA